MHARDYMYRILVISCWVRDYRHVQHAGLRPIVFQNDGTNIIFIGVHRLPLFNVLASHGVLSDFLTLAFVVVWSDLSPWFQFAFPWYVMRLSISSQIHYLFFSSSNVWILRSAGKSTVLRKMFKDSNSSRYGVYLSPHWAEWVSRFACSTTWKPFSCPTTTWFLPGQALWKILPSQVDLDLNSTMFPTYVAASYFVSLF